MIISYIIIKYIKLNILYGMVLKYFCGIIIGIYCRDKYFS
jgi:hypothetical protein